MEMTNEILRFGKRALKSSAAPLSRALDARRWLSNFDGAEAGQVAIFGYHRVVPGIEQAEREAVYGLVTSSETFRRHLQLVRERYEVLSLSEAAAVLRGERQTARAAAVVTFDDGYRDVYDHALPGLKEFGIPATVFVSTSYIGSGQILDHDRLYWLILKARAHRVADDLHRG
jgi:peptidoglycan/xylan/chitin deacetylase (PgdA/CDA1 family)